MPTAGPTSSAPWSTAAGAGLAATDGAAYEPAADGAPYAAAGADTGAADTPATGAAAGASSSAIVALPSPSTMVIVAEVRCMKKTSSGSSRSSGVIVTLTWRVSSHPARLGHGVTPWSSMNGSLITT